MSVDVEARLSSEDLIRWRYVCAGMEVARRPTRDLTAEQARSLWIEYYEVTKELHEKYGIREEDTDIAVITTGNGFIYYEED